MLICTQTGHVMHVDFGVLFDEGESLFYPETVPYRLTHNLVDGMGVLGYEGCFRTTCERLYDAFVMDIKVCTPSFGTCSPSLTSLTPTKIEGELSRLKGRCEERLVSVEEQVHITKEQATSIDELVKMYYGWTSFL